MTNKMMVWMVGMIALLVFSAQSVHAQQKPSNVLIWCKNADGTSSPCTAGNSLDYDTGGGTVNQGTIGFVVPGAGGPVAAGTASAPMRVDPTGTTTQPVSASSLPLPTGAATAANQDGIIKDGTGDAGQANVTNGNVHQNISRINDVVPLMGAGNTGTGSPRVTEATDSQLSTGVGATGDAAATAGGTGSINAKLRLLTDLVNQVLTELGQKTEPANTQAISAASLPLPTGAATAANQDGIIKDGTGDAGQANVTNGNVHQNISRINDVVPLMGAGNTGTGSPRVTEATDSQLSTGVGATGDAAATAGSTGSITAKLRLMTSQLDTISTNLSSLLTSSQLVDDDQTGASVHYRTSAGGSAEDEHEVKGSAGRLFSITATNTNAAVRYLRCANQVIGSTTPGTTTVFLGLAIPGATTGAGFTTNFGPMGIAFSTGLTCWLVTGAADTDVAEVAANEIKVIYSYK